MTKINWLRALREIRSTMFFSIMEIKKCKCDNKHSGNNFLMVTLVYTSVSLVVPWKLILPSWQQLTRVGESPVRAWFMYKSRASVTFGSPFFYFHDSFFGTWGRYSSKTGGRLRSYIVYCLGLSAVILERTQQSYHSLGALVCERAQRQQQRQQRQQFVWFTTEIKKILFRLLPFFMNSRPYLHKIWRRAKTLQQQKIVKNLASSRLFLSILR